MITEIIIFRHSGSAKCSVISGADDTALFEKQHLPRLDEITCLEPLEIDAGGIV